MTSPGPQLRRRCGKQLHGTRLLLRNRQALALVELDGRVANDPVRAANTWPARPSLSTSGILIECRGINAVNSRSSKRRWRNIRPGRADYPAPYGLWWRVACLSNALTLRNQRRYSEGWNLIFQLNINGLVFGWGGRVRTSAWWNQNPLPYHLATPQRSPDPQWSVRSERTIVKRLPVSNPVRSLKCVSAHKNQCAALSWC